MRRSMSGALALLALWPFGFVFGGDSLRPTHGGSREKGAIVDGTTGGVAVNDRSFTELQGGSFLTALFPVIPIGDFTASTNNEAIAFAGRHPPVLVPAAWTPADDTVTFAFEDEYRIPVQVWIVRGPFATVRDVAIDGSVRTSEIWSGERQGIAFESFDIVDATGDPDVPGLLDFDCTLVAEIKSKIGFTLGRINVYYVSTVDFGDGPLSSNGVMCANSGVIGMGATTADHLLAHEIGHAFSLQHTTYPPQSQFFDEQNVMHPSSSDRRYLTEGQTFLSVFSIFSALNSQTFYGPTVRPGAPTRNCNNDASTTIELCPPIQKQIWADGLWPPN